MADPKILMKNCSYPLRILMSYLNVKTYEKETDPSADDVVELFELHLNSLYFVARDEFYQQCELRLGQPGHR